MLLVTWLVILPLYFKWNGAKQLAVKAVPPLMAAFAALFAFAQSQDRYALLVMIALFVCAAADILLGVKFIVGGALFFTGHMLYLTALGTVMQPTWRCIAVFVPAMLGLWLFCRRYFDHFPSKWLYVGVLVYCMALSMLLGFSLPLPFVALSRRTVLAAIGAALFVVSDMGTCHAMLTPASRRFNFVSLGVYYTAQILLGLSAFA